MSIIKLSPENFQTYKLIANPKRVFHSSSTSGITGSVALLSDASPSVKSLDVRRIPPSFELFEKDLMSPAELTQAYELMTLFVIGMGAFGDDSMFDAAMGELLGGRADATEIYLQLVNNKTPAIEDSKRQEVLRFLPGARLNKSFNRKRTIKGALFPYYRYKYENLNWAYTNYNTLNFFESSNTPNDSAIIYPATTTSGESSGTNFYAPSSSFTFDFYVKPKVNKSLSPGSAYNAGTVLHMSSCYAVSIISGSSFAPDGLSDTFRVLFQLSQSADIAPRDISINGNVASSNYGDNGLLFVSEDHSLVRDKWNHVTIRWPGASVNAGSGSIVVDGKTKSEFIISSASVMSPISLRSGFEDSNALFVGNYYEGTNFNNQAISRFFNQSVATEAGLKTLSSGSANLEPFGFKLRHPLVSEVHDLKIFNSFKSDAQVESMRTSGINRLTKDLLFFVPPFFVKESRKRQIMQTPFFKTSGSSDDPFNVALSFGVGGLEVNTENFCREFVQKEYPRFYNMSSSVTNTAVFQEGMTSDDILYSSGSSIKRLYSILPCDNPHFRPNFQLLQTGSQNKVKFVDDFGIERFDLITLENMVSTDSLPKGLSALESLPAVQLADAGALKTAAALDFNEDNAGNHGFSITHDLQGASPEDPSVDPGNILTILYRTGDPDSNQVVMFDASNMLYGDRIVPGSLTIEDNSPFKSGNSFTFKLKDNARGNIYRCDTHDGIGAEWASVGNVLYEEGLIVIKSPHLSFFGHNEFKMTFEGERSIYVFEVSIPLEQNVHNSSSNPQYKELRPTNNYNETAEDFTYITGLQLHDNNLNVIGRANFAQPYVKREEDRVVVKLRMDF